MINQDSDIPRRPRPRRRRKWRWVVLVALAVLVTGSAVAVRIVTDPKRLRRYAQQYLQQFVDAPVSVGSARVSALNEIEIRDVTVADAGAESPFHRPALRLGRIVLEHRPAHLLLARLSISRIQVSDAACRAVFDHEKSNFNLQRLIRPRQTDGGDGESGPLPEIALRSAQVDVRRQTGGTDESVERLVLSASARPAADDPRSYEIQWSVTSDRFDSGKCRLDTRRMVLQDAGGGVPWLSLETASMAVDSVSPAAGRWLELLGVKGRFRIREFQLTAAPDRQQTVVLELEGASLSIPIDEVERRLPASERYLQLVDVSGQLSVFEGGAQADLTGALHGSSCCVSATITGQVSRTTLLSDLGFDIDVELRDFILPRNDPTSAPADARIIAGWPRLTKFYRDYDPSGKVDVTLALSKLTGAHEPVSLKQMVLQARGADAAVRYFPYRVRDLTGRIRLTPAGLDIIGLTGTHGTGRITVDGHMTSTASACGVQLFITGETIELDDELCGALADRYRSLWDKFSPRGFADVEVTLMRPERPDAPGPWSTWVEANLLGADARFAGFAYPVSDLTGHVSIGADHISVTHLQGRATEGLVQVSGEGRMADEGVAELRVQLEAAGVPLDETLFSALAPETRREVEHFSPRGVLNLGCDIVYSHQSDQVQYDIDARLVDGSVCWTGLPLPLDSVRGRLIIRPDVIEVLNLNGRRGPMTVAVQGRVRNPHTDPQPDLSVRAHRVQIDEHLMEVLPRQAQQVLEHWNLAGEFGFQSAVRTVKSGDDPNWRTQIEVAGIQASYREFDWPVELTGGTLVVENDRIELQQVAARRGDSTLAIDGTLRTAGDGTSARFSLAASSIPFDESLRQALPWRLRRRYNDIQPTGRFNLAIDSIGYDRSGPNAVPRWQVDGGIGLDDAAFMVGVKLTEVNGSVRLRGEGMNAFSEISAAGRLDLDRIRINDQPLERVTASVGRDGPANRWLFEDVQASVHGGRLEGNVRLDGARNQTRYDASCTIQQMGLEGFVNTRRARDAELAPVHLEGQVSGRMYVSGASGDSESLRGGGRFVIDKAELFRLPVTFSILQVLNASQPQNAVQRAESEFLLLGDEVQFKPLQLEGPGLHVVGKGSMSISTEELNLTLVAIYPQKPVDVPVVTEMLEGAARELIEIVVQGTPQHPRAVTRPFRGLGNAMEALLTPKDERRRD